MRLRVGVQRGWGGSVRRRAGGRKPGRVEKGEVGGSGKGEGKMREGEL